MSSVLLEMNSLSSYSASTLLKSTADLKVLKCLENVDEKLLQPDLAKLSTGHWKQEMFKVNTSVISDNGHRQSLRKEPNGRHKSRCETLWNIPQIQGEEIKLSYLVKECQRVISVCKKVQYEFKMMQNVHYS